jgi:hypothetical protein
MLSILVTFIGCHKIDEMQSLPFVYFAKIFEDQLFFTGKYFLTAARISSISNGFAK